MYYCKQRYGIDQGSCQRDSTCGLRAGNVDNPSLTFADSSSAESNAQRIAIASVGALSWPPNASWASAFLVGNGYVLTAGHVLHDVQLAASYTLILNLELKADIGQRITRSLDPLPMTDNKKWIQRLDDTFDFALCKVAARPEDLTLQGFRPPVPASKPPQEGDTLHVIHHSLFARVKQVTTVKCVKVIGQNIYLSEGLEDGSSGGLIVNSDWHSVGLFTHGGAKPARGIALGAIAQEVVNGRLAMSELVKLTGMMVPTNAELAQVPKRRPLQPFFPTGFSPENNRVRKNSLPNPVQEAMKSTGILVLKQTDNGIGRVGTCAMLESNWIITAHHIVDCKEFADSFCVDFEYKNPKQHVNIRGANTIAEGGAHHIQYALEPDDGFFSSKDGIYSCDGTRYEHDFSLVKVRHVTQSVATPIGIASQRPAANSKVFLIQHPRKLPTGVFKDPKPLYPQHQDKVVGYDDLGFVYHACSRDNGASGGPLVNEKGEMFAMHTHRADPDETLDAVKLRRKFNWGVTLHEVARQLQQSAKGRAILEELPSIKALLA